jgi:hypothetical protein
MVVIKGFFALIALIVIGAIIAAGTIGPAVAYFVWGWKVALGWFFVNTGLSGLVQVVKVFAAQNND